jgi:hypothetical protein
MMNSRTLDLIGAAFFLVLGIAFAVSGYQLASGGGNWMADRGFWPQWIGIFLIAASVVAGFNALRGERRMIEVLPTGRTFLLLLAIIVFFLALPWLGYVIGAFLWLIATGAIAGERSPWRLAGFSAAAVAVGYLVFWQILLVPLPVGELERLLGLDALIYR